MSIKKINPDSIHLASVHRWDHPDYSDAYIEYAEWEDGTPLTDEELESANDREGELINEIANLNAWSGWL